MANIFNVARYILSHKGKMSTWKLQKLCFYSQAWALAWTEKPLFEEDFEAWTNGPVSPVLFEAHRGRFSVSEHDFPLTLASTTDLTDDEKDTIDRVLDYYGKLEPYQLREQTHSELPWKDARGNIPDGEPCNHIISKDSMGAFYGGL